MPSLKVRRSKLPYKALSELERQADADLGKLLRTAQELIANDIRSAPPDPEEFAVEGALKKSLPEERRDAQEAQALRDHARREEHGAPNTPNQLGPADRRALIERLPWRGGRLTADPSRLRTTRETGTTEEELVPTSLISYGGFDAAELDQALQGKGGTPELLRQEGGKQLWCTKNPATVFAAAALHLPAIVANVTTVRETEPLPGATEATQDMKETETLARAITQQKAYVLPSRLEPLAEQARTHDPETLRILLKGEKSPEEQAARARADERDRARTELWKNLYNERRAEGLSDAEANRAVREDPKWDRAEQLAEKSLELAAMIEERWDGWRADVHQALQQTLWSAEEDGTKASLIPLADLYHEAGKGRPEPEDTSLTTGTLTDAYLPGEEVEVRDSQGKWSPGTVRKTENGSARVLRDDGQYRTVSDPTAIRRKGEGNIGLDNGDRPEYNKDMAEIRVPQFNVIIPAGSNSAKIEHALEPITEEMNNTPLQVNKATWERNLDAQARELERLTEECHAMAGKKFRPNASRDCSQLLFEELGLPVQRVNKKSGEPACDKDTLQALHAMGNDIAGKIIEAREAQSRLSQLQAWAPYAEAGTVQASWNQQGTPMARYSCDSPNLQNRITAIRETIEAPTGHKFVSCDLGQAEYVTWASLSGDPTLSQAFAEGKDFHRQMYEEVHAAAPEVDLHEQDPRQAGKTINFALLYLMQAFVLAKRLGIDPAAAAKIIEAYHARAPLATKYVEAVLDQARKTGQVSTKFGRTRYMPELRKATGPALHEARKTAWHHHNAGTAAELLKIKQAKTWRALRREGITAEQARVALQMHDELILVCKDEVLADVQAIALEKFKEPIPGFLPFRVDQRTGQNWLNISK